MRLFVAIDLGDEIRHRLAAMLDDIPIPGKRVAPPQWHITLRFVGESDQVGLERLCFALEAAAVPGGFDVTIGGLGGFPRLSKATVVWMGVEGGRLKTLGHRVEDAVQEAGFPAEERPFSPHLTLSRVRPPADVRALADIFPGKKLRMPVGEIVLFRSHVGGPEGTWYESLESFPLG